ncbi:hypothetical protein TraAM80_05676 [Trypanosoma rangeli]|uniref:Uncharacterized protein n=1 Tax=Trypanosoma rangeli TaxID=5698 RepID=A0A422NDC8_TRYRA|nr:uncharacterized protein TraAM80_05676 [Trypanosoma rangeli]RNF03504.1 hypothetical protein TraAM80_05676 [Trypanosoma rangeli]|eukprot:RNF03504.1 hypothetical protein TraAM80_05676 [Trypanosoma rangeli]
MSDGLGLVLLFLREVAYSSPQGWTGVGVHFVGNLLRQGLDACRSLLVDELNWNQFGGGRGGSDRQRWYCLVTAKLAELLNRRGITLATRLDEECGASCSTEGGWMARAAAERGNNNNNRQRRQVDASS